MKVLMIGQTIISLGALLIYRAITDINSNLYTIYKAIKEDENKKSEV